MSFEEIAQCALRYAAVQQQLTDSEHRVGTPVVRVDVAEQLLRARLDLAACLIRAGWSPNDEVRSALQLDQAVLQESNGALLLAESDQ